MKDNGQIDLTTVSLNDFLCKHWNIYKMFDGGLKVRWTVSNKQFFFGLL